MSIGWTLILFLFILAVDSADPRRNVALPSTPGDSLRMREGAPFRIALFADLHFGEDAWTDWGPQQDIKSQRVMSNVLDKENPDFVIYLGDVITANNIMIKNASSYWEQALSPTRKRGIPWCSVFGNHDDASFEWPMEWFSATGIPQIHCPSANSSCQLDSFSGAFVSDGEECSFKGTSRLELMTSEIEGNTLSHSMNGPQTLWPSVSNYVLKILSSGDSQAVLVFMYFLDSGGGSYPEVISDAQVKWFQQKSQEVNPDSRVPEIIFWHIPTKAYKEMAPKPQTNKCCVGSIFLEEVANQEAEMGIMKVLEDRPSVNVRLPANQFVYVITSQAVFVGHNHGLDWCCPYKEKLWLCFARHTGYGGYGNWSRGARIIEIKQNPFSLKSWIRMEDGQLHSEVLLSS